MFTELHIIQSFAPSNLNRDDTGQPKDCLFGGARRARISSQCLKSAMRSAPSFAATTGVASGVRTKRLLDALSKQMPADLPADLQSRVLPLATRMVTTLYSKIDGKDASKTAVLLYVSEREMAEMAAELEQTVRANGDAKAQEKAIDDFAKEFARSLRSRTSAPDIALFGRMLAENPELNIDAACQVAHALSTHRITMEMDFYTAVDQLRPEDTAGADMMGFTGFNSACFYRYARIDWEQLLANLNGDADLAFRTVEGFIQASIDAVPTGKQNSSAANNPPSAVLAVVRREGMAWSLANAFETPVRAGDGGYVVPSLQRLEEYYSRLAAVYGDESVAGLSLLSFEPGMEWKALAQAVAPSRAAFLAATLAAARRAAGAEGAA